MVSFSFMYEHTKTKLFFITNEVFIQSVNMNLINSKGIYNCWLPSIYCTKICPAVIVDVYKPIEIEMLNQTKFIYAAKVLQEIVRGWTQICKLSEQNGVRWLAYFSLTWFNSHEKLMFINGFRLDTVVCYRLTFIHSGIRKISLRCLG